MFCIFWLGNALCATAAGIFRHPNSRNSSVLSILTWKCASPHSGVCAWRCLYLLTWKRASRYNNFSFLPWPHDSASAVLANLLFDAPNPPNHWKHSDSRLAWHFARLYLISSDCWFLFLTLLLCAAFQVSIFSEIRFLNFLRSSFAGLARKNALLKLRNLTLIMVPIIFWSGNCWLQQKNFWWTTGFKQKLWCSLSKER